MRFLRLFNPLRHLRLEREVAAIPSMKRGIKSLVDSIGRQAEPGSLTECLGNTVLLDGRVHALEVAAGVALNYLRDGRTSQAESVLAAILDTMPVDQREAG